MTTKRRKKKKTESNDMHVVCMLYCTYICVVPANVKLKQKKANNRETWNEKNTKFQEIHLRTM